MVIVLMGTETVKLRRENQLLCEFLLIKVDPLISAKVSLSEVKLFESWEACISLALCITTKSHMLLLQGKTFPMKTERSDWYR